jgi:hypothetical protein
MVAKIACGGPVLIHESTRTSPAPAAWAPGGREVARQSLES